MTFLIKVTDGQKQSTKKLKYSLLRSFFNFIKDLIDSALTNPCDTPILRKTFKTAKGQPPKSTLEKSVIRKQFIGLIIFTDRILGGLVKAYPQ